MADTRQFEADPVYLTHRLRPRKWHFCCRVGHPLAGRDSVSATELMSYPMAVTIRPPNLRKVIVDLSGRPDFTPNVECENSYSLLSVVMRSDAIGIVGAYADALHHAKGELVCLKVEGLADDLEEMYTRYGIVSRAGYRLSPLAEAMIAQIKEVDEQDEDVYSLENLAV